MSSPNEAARDKGIDAMVRTADASVKSANAAQSALTWARVSAIAAIFAALAAGVMAYSSLCCPGR